MTKAIVFDMDGVLFDSEQLYKRLWVELAHQHHIEGVEDVVNACLGVTITQERQIYLDHYGPDFPYDTLMKQVSDDFFKYIHTHGMPLKPGVNELLAFLKADHYKIALATSTKKDAVDWELKDTGIYDYFDVIITGDMVTESKPSPEIYLKACAALQADPQNTWAVEDSFNGVTSAHHANMKVIMIPDLIQPDEHISSMTSFIGTSLFDIVELLKA